MRFEGEELLASEGEQVGDAVGVDEFGDQSAADILDVETDNPPGSSFPGTRRRDDVTLVVRTRGRFEADRGHRVLSVPSGVV
ncbi:hypothetical protein ACIRL2_45005 [Embleya sp. NPDC127516]|uniref:hypothetical protein n=1 Tax=Embleya sp. NPDC127516 TaxID=3363990 RepID=UPI0038213508